MPRRVTALSFCAAVLVAACGGAASSPAPSVTPTPAPATPAPTAPPTASPTPFPSGPATVSAPAELAAGAEFEIAWTGPGANGDYVTIVAAGATAWTNEPYFYTLSATSPGTLTAPVAAGDYEIWYVRGADSSIAARQAVTVTALAATVSGPADVGANTQFEASWTGPDGNGDYVTIVAAGATRWTNEAYFYTRDGATGTLLAPVTPGAYELWYVTGSDGVAKAKQPITVTPLVITLSAPDRVAKGAAIEVSWTGPDGPGDYLTILPAGATRWTDEPYVYTRDGATGSLTAPDAAGAYEICYITGQSTDPVARRPITVG